MKEPLHLLPIEKWIDLQRAFKSEWPQGVAGYYVLKTQKDWLRKGYQYGFKVYCPYGDVWNGFVAINIKKDSYEIIIQCPQEDTTKLEEALRLTKVVDWTKTIVVPFAPQNVLKCLKRFSKFSNITISLEPDFRFILDKSNGIYDVRIPPGITYGFAKKEHIDLIDSTWQHRYPTSSWYFKQMIDMNSGYALYKNSDIIAWLFINECGALTHLYVIDEERNKGYALLLMKLVSNNLLKDNRDVLVYCLQENTKSYNLIKKLGFKLVDEVNWMFLKKYILEDDLDQY